MICLFRCENSYIKLIDTTGTYDLCGVERKTFFETFCSNQIDILYMAADTPLNAGFRGFKLYYESKYILYQKIK
jgi:hypothetical protein